MYTEPVEFSYLNLDPQSATTVPIPTPEGNLLTYTFELSDKTILEKRNVVSIPTMLGDIGGLYGTLASLAFFFLGSIPEKLLLIN